MAAEVLAVGTLQAANVPQGLRAELVPSLEELVARRHPEGLWLYSYEEACGYGNWARGSASRRSVVDLLVMGLAAGACSTPTTRCSKRCSLAACPCNPWWPARRCCGSAAMPPSGAP